jgi:hypothetical protein
MTNPATESKRLPKRLIVLALVLLLALACVDASMRPIEPEPNVALVEPTDPANVQQAIGRALRVAIDAAYRNARRESGSVGNGDLTALVERFIPVGSTLIDGEAVLHHAGLRVDHIVRDRLNEVFASTPYTSQLVCGTSLLVTLFPALSGESNAAHGDTVARLSASFFTVCL